MKMKIEDGKFYVLEAGNEKWIYSLENEAINSLKEMLSENKSLDEKNISILEVDMREENWQVKQIPWSKIALKLIRGEE